MNARENIINKNVSKCKHYFTQDFENIFGKIFLALMTLALITLIIFNFL